MESMEYFQEKDEFGFLGCCFFISAEQESVSKDNGSQAASPVILFLWVWVSQD